MLRYFSAGLRPTPSPNLDLHPAPASTPTRGRTPTIDAAIGCAWLRAD